MIYLEGMKPTRPFPLFVTLTLSLLVISFAAGTLLAFKEVHAASVATPVQGPSATPTPSAGAAPASANMTGILLLGILLVAIILLGILWGRRTAAR